MAHSNHLINFERIKDIKQHQGTIIKGLPVHGNLFTIAMKWHVNSDDCSISNSVNLVIQQTIIILNIMQENNG
jgi:hypothetical protein